MLTTNTKIPYLLAATGFFEAGQPATLLANARENSLSIREAVLAGTELKEDEFLEKLAGVMSLGYQRLKDVEIDAAVLEKLPPKAVFQYNVIPLAEEATFLTVATSDPFTPGLVDALRLAAECRIRLVLSPAEDIATTAKKFYGVGAETLDRMMQDDRIDLEDEESLLKQDLSELDQEASVVKFVNQIIFEAHTRLNPPQAVELCNALESYRPFYVEDPIRSENPASFAHLRAHTNVALGTGEQLHDKWTYRELIERELVDYLRVDICHTGGITEGKKIAAMGEVHYQELACHYTASPVSTAAMLHLNMSIPNCAVQEFAPTGGWMDDVIQHSWVVEDGYLLKPETPGLGVDINEEAAAAHPTNLPDEPPHWRRPDGSVNDW